MATITGTEGNDQAGSPTGPIRGTGNADLIDALGGDDQVFAGGGHDEVYGGNGNNELSGEGGNDDLYGGNDRDLIRGGKGHDYLQGNGGDDRLEGGAGNDVLFGSGGFDRLFGGAGNDILGAGGDGDRIDGELGIDSYNCLEFNDVTVDLASGQGIGGDQLKNIENVTGGSSDDRLFGNDGSNRLIGLPGDDLLVGRGGADVLWGDADGWSPGRDVFAYQQISDSTAAARDRIMDFQDSEFSPSPLPHHVAVDQIDLSAIDARVTLPGDQTFSFVGTNQFSGAGQVRYHHESGNTVVEVNVGGSSAPEMVIELSGQHDLATLDFVL